MSEAKDAFLVSHIYLLKKSLLDNVRFLRLSDLSAARQANLSYWEFQSPSPVASRVRVKAAHQLIPEILIIQSSLLTTMGSGRQGKTPSQALSFETVARAMVAFQVLLVQ